MITGTTGFVGRILRELQATHLSEDEVRQELAVLLFQKDALTLGETSWLQFQHLLTSHKIPVHYDVVEFEADLKMLREMGRI